MFLRDADRAWKKEEIRVRGAAFLGLEVELKNRGSLVGRRFD